MNVCYTIADSIHRFRQRRKHGDKALRTNSLEDYWKWQFQTSPAYFAKFYDLTAKLQNATVIGIGCGLGGRTCYLAGLGVRNVIGVDINQAEVEQATNMKQRLAGPEVTDKVQFKTVHEFTAADHKPAFDIALLVDSLEHVLDPTAILNQAYELLHPGGICYFSTWGWYHHQASHVSSIVPIPFATLFFSDKQILDAVRRIVEQEYYQPSMWDSNPPALRWQGIRSLHDRPGEYLNKFTIRRFRKAISASSFGDWQLKAEGFSSARHPRLAWFNFLSRVPIVQEIYHSALFGRLVKVPAPV